jgi:hypothetical protein
MNRLLAVASLLAALILASLVIFQGKLFGLDSTLFLQGLLTGLAVLFLLETLQAVTKLDEEPSSNRVDLEPFLTHHELSRIEERIFGRSEPNIGYSFPGTLRLSPNPMFALGEMRIQLERSLRSLAERSRTILAVSQLGTHQLIERLMREDVVPWPLFQSLEQIIELTDQAFQGRRVEWVDAEAIISSGARVINMLEALPNQGETPRLTNASSGRLAPHTEASQR